MTAVTTAVIRMAVAERNRRDLDLLFLTNAIVAQMFLRVPTRNDIRPARPSKRQSDISLVVVELFSALK